MSSADVLAIMEFRKFINSYIYSDTVDIIISDISKLFVTNNISYESLPQPIIKFSTGIEKDSNLTQYTEKLHIALKGIFMNFFSRQDIIKTIRNKIYLQINDDDIKISLFKVLTEVQIGTPQFISLLFNITILQDGTVYLYL